MERNKSPKIIITSGEPAGIGPDICLKLSRRTLDGRLLVIGNETLFKERADQLGITVKLNVVDSVDEHIDLHQPGQLNILQLPLPVASQAAILNLDNAIYVLQQLETAIDACRSGQFQAMVTCPVHKGVINQAGISFTGHTEFLAEKTATHLPVMMLQNEELRVALVTTHLPLRDVPKVITRELLVDVVKVLQQDLKKRYAITDPVIMVCGLNPHAGEGGYLGDEELRIIEPALQECRAMGINVVGPLSADTIFSEGNIKTADVFLAMYHDQGLPVIKYRGFGQTVNVTLGLPFIRTSVDHGTALELAGTGSADDNSFFHAIKLACNLKQNF